MMKWKTDIKKMENMVCGFYGTDIRVSKKKLHCLKSIKNSSLKVVDGISSQIPSSIMFWNNEKHFAFHRKRQKKTARCNSYMNAT